MPVRERGHDGMCHVRSTARCVSGVVPCGSVIMRIWRRARCLPRRDSEVAVWLEFFPDARTCNGQHVACRLAMRRLEMCSLGALV